jgi:hypothetical protein
MDKQKRMKFYSRAVFLSKKKQLDTAHEEFITEQQGVNGHQSWSKKKE